MPHRQSATEFARERQKIEFVGQPAMIAQSSLLEPFEVGREVLLRRPARAVDALEHRVLLAPPPVGAGDLHQLEVAEMPGVGHVRADTHVDERIGVAVEADDVAAGLAGQLVVDLVRVDGRHGLDDRPLVRMVGHQFERLRRRRLGTHERLPGLDDLAYLGLDRRQVLLAEGGTRPAARSRSRSRPRSAGRWRRSHRATVRAPLGPARGPSSGAGCGGPRSLSG